jgi:hypothetical protein
MRKFKCSGLRPDYRYTLTDAIEFIRDDGDANTLADLQIGEFFLDVDDDTWERVE